MVAHRRGKVGAGHGDYGHLPGHDKSGYTTAMRRSLFLCAAIALAGCAHRGISSSGGWQAVRTRHFTFYTTTSHQYDATLVAAEHSYSGLSASFFSSVELGNVEVLFLEDDDFGSLLGYKRSAAALARVPGGGKIGQHGLLVLRNDPRGVSQHQMLTHLFLERRIPGAPLWLHEMMATYDGGMVVMGGKVRQVACFGRPRPGRDGLIPVRELFGTDWDRFDEGPRSWLRHTGGVLMDYILFAEQARYRPRFDQIIGGVMDGKPGPELFTAVFPEIPLDAWNAKISNHDRDLQYLAGSPVRGLCPMGFEVPAEKVADPRQREITPVPPEDIGTLLGALKSLPRRDDGFPSWYPLEVIARVDGKGSAGPGAAN
jgi:hypothetical protein